MTGRRGAVAHCLGSWHRKEAAVTVLAQERERTAYRDMIENLSVLWSSA